MYKKISRGSELLLSAARYGSAPRPPSTALTSFKKRTYIRDNTVPWWLPLNLDADTRFLGAEGGAIPASTSCL